MKMEIRKRYNLNKLVKGLWNKIDNQYERNIEFKINIIDLDCKMSDTGLGNGNKWISKIKQ